MAIELQEFIGSKPINKKAINNLNCNEYEIDLDPVVEDSIMQDIEGLHVGPTRNFTWYMEEALDSSIPSWTRPYQKPLIMHHNEESGKIIGRVVFAKKISINTRSGTPALLFTCNVPDKDGKEQILDGRLKTVSVGVTAHDIRCSICGKQVELDEDGYSICGHDRGISYNNEICYWKIYSMEAKELSYVIVPSDIYAHNIRTYKPTKQTKIKLQENLKQIKGDLKMEKEIDITEKQNIDEQIKDGDVADKVATQDETKKETEKSIIEQKDEEIKLLKEEIEALKSKNDDTSLKLEKIQKDLEVSIGKISEVENKLKTEITLKEAAEDYLIKAKTEVREYMEENLNILRTALNKPIVLKESLTERSTSSIKDSIIDLKEELGGFNKVKNITPVKEEGLKIQENAKKNKLDVKESKLDSNKDVIESIDKILSDLIK